MSPAFLAETGVAVVLALLCSGCKPSLMADETPINSVVFSKVRVIGSRGVGVGELNKPRSVAVDREDNLYVVDMTGRVQKFSPEGKPLLSWQLPQTDLGKPKGMCRDRDGNIIVVEPHYSRVNEYSPDGRLVLQWGRFGTNAGHLKFPRAVAVDSRGEVFVCEYGVVERVQKFIFDPVHLAPAAGVSNLPPPGEGSGEGGLQYVAQTSGDPLPWSVRAPLDAASPRWLASYGEPGNGPGQFNRAEGLFVDNHDRLYVADSCNHRIQIFDTNGKFIRDYGHAGTGKGEMSYPYDVCVDVNGWQYVCEFGNSRIQIFDEQERPVEILGGPGAAPGCFNNPWGVALDSHGDLYVADSQNHRVQKFTRRQSLALK